MFYVTMESDCGQPTYHTTCNLLEEAEALLIQNGYYPSDCNVSDAYGWITDENGKVLACFE